MKKRGIDWITGISDIALLIFSIKNQCTINLENAMLSERGWVDQLIIMKINNNIICLQ